MLLFKVILLVAGKSSDILKMLCCQRRKSNYFVQVEGDFYRDLTRKVTLVLQEVCFSLCPLIIPVTLYLTPLSSDYALPISFGILHN